MRVSWRAATLDAEILKPTNTNSFPIVFLSFPSGAPELFISFFASFFISFFMSPTLSANGCERSADAGFTCALHIHEIRITPIRHVSHVGYARDYRKLGARFSCLWFLDFQFSSNCAPRNTKLLRDFNNKTICAYATSVCLLPNTECKYEINLSAHFINIPGKSCEIFWWLRFDMHVF